MEKTPVWQMIKEAIENLNDKASYPEIKKYINSKWENVNQLTINAQLIVLSVNQPSRIHYAENKNPRISNSRYDILFSTGSGQVVKYNKEEHGVWEIYKTESGGLAIRQVNYEDTEIEDISSSQEANSFLFPIEANLRDFLILNLHTIRDFKLKLYVDENGRDGKEYLTKVGLIDILTVDEKGNFIVLELKLSRGPDKALGQLLRYMGWIKENLAKDKEVRGLIIANKMDDKIKYAVMMAPNVTLYEYEMRFELSKPKD